MSQNITRIESGLLYFGNSIIVMSAVNGWVLPPEKAVKPAIKIDINGSASFVLQGEIPALQLLHDIMVKYFGEVNGNTLDTSQQIG